MATKTNNHNSKRMLILPFPQINYHQPMSDFSNLEKVKKNDCIQLHIQETLKMVQKKDSLSPTKNRSKKVMKKIKYPPSAFLLFCKDFRLQIHQKCPGLSPIDLTRLLSQLWKYLELEVKQIYIQKRQKIIDDFIIEHPNYNGETSVDLDESINSEKAQENYYPFIDSNYTNNTDFVNHGSIDINNFLSHFQGQQPENMV